MPTILDRPKVKSSKTQRRYDPINPYAVLYYLHNLPYPASKESIVFCANQNNAPIDVIQIIDQIPAQNYRSELELIRVIARIQ